METKKIELEVSKESYDLGVCVQKLLSSLGTALEDGWQTGTDLPTVLVSTLGTFPEAIAGADKIDDDFNENPMSTINGVTVPLMIGISDLIAGLKKAKQSSEGE